MKKIIFTLLIVFISINITIGQQTQSKEKEKAKFGLYFNNLSDTQKRFNAETSGVVVNRVSKGHSGETAGVLVGDILTHIDAITIKDQEHCIQIMKDYDNTKTTASLKVIRNGVKMDLKVKFKE